MNFTSQFVDITLKKETCYMLYVNYKIYKTIIIIKN